MLHEDLSEAVIGAAMKVLNTLRPGLDEKLYENSSSSPVVVIGFSSSRHFPQATKISSLGTLIPDPTHSCSSRCA